MSLLQYKDTYTLLYNSDLEGSSCATLCQMGLRKS